MTEGLSMPPVVSESPLSVALSAHQLKNDKLLSGKMNVVNDFIEDPLTPNFCALSLSSGVNMPYV